MALPEVPVETIIRQLINNPPKNKIVSTKKKNIVVVTDTHNATTIEIRRIALVKATLEWANLNRSALFKRKLAQHVLNERWSRFLADSNVRVFHEILALALNTGKGKP